MGFLLWIRQSELTNKPIPRVALYWQLVAAIFVALATWARWVALDTVPVTVVTALSRISVPLVIVLSILLLDQKHERVNLNVWIGGNYDCRRSHDLNIYILGVLNGH